jgi:hypothetical protein
MATNFATISSLGKIITDAITAGVATNIPARSIRKTLIKVTTGQYREVLPIIIPAECCIMGDELRSVNVQPRKSTNSTLTPKSDYRYTSKALERIEQVVGNVASGLTMTPTTGNTLTQTTAYPYAETPQAWEGLTRQVRGIRRNIDAQLGEKLYAQFPKPWEMTNANAGRGRDLFLQNREFIKTETTAYITENYPNLKYSRTKCKQDIGFILDAIAYDLTYGGNWQSVVAGEAYYTGAVLEIAASEKAATIAAYGFMKQLVQTVQRNITVTPVLQTDVAQIAGVGGTASESTTIGNLFDDITDTINSGVGTVSEVYPSVAGANALTFADTQAIDAAKDQVGEYTIDFISKNFGSFKYDSGICRRDLEILSEGAQNDTLTGSNYLAIQAGRAYRRETSEYLQGAQKSQTVGAIRKFRDLQLADLTDSTYITRTTSFYNEVVDILQNSTTAEDALTFPSYNSTANAINAKNLLVANRQFIIDDVVNYVENTYNNPPGSFVYDRARCERDVAFIIDGLCHDIMYGGNIAQIRIAKSYFNLNGASVIPGEATETIAAYGHLSSVAQDVITEVSITKQTGNTQTQSTNGSPASATEEGLIVSFITEVTNAITADSPAGISAITEVTSTEAGQTATDYALFDTNRDGHIKTTLQFVTDTYSDFKFNHAKCTRDLGLIFDAAKYDALLGTNIASIITAFSYRRKPARTKVIADQKDATIAANMFAMREMQAVLSSEQCETSVQLEETFEWVNDTIWTASYEGANKQVVDPEIYNAQYQLETNKEWIVQEALNEADECYKAAVSKVEANGTVTVADTSWLSPGMGLKLVNYEDSTDAVVEAGGDTDTTYYVKSIESDTTFIASTTVNGSAFAFDPTEAAFQYNKNKCRRDTGYFLDAVGYDITLGTNYNAVTQGLAYQRASASVANGAQLAQTTAGINFTKAKVAELYKVRTSTTGLSRSNAFFAEIVDVLNNGVGNADAITYPAPAGATANTTNAVAQLGVNKAFMIAEITAWIAVNYPSLSYDVAKCERDVGYVIDALRYDIMYGGTSASHQAARSYFVDGVYQGGAGEGAATAAAYNRLSVVTDEVIREVSVTKSSGNAANQDTSGTAASATEGTLSQTLLQLVEDVITDGDLDGLPTATYPDVNGATADLKAAQIQIKRNADDIVIKTVKYIDNTYSAMFEVKSSYVYNRTLCARDVREYVYGMKWDAAYSRNWAKRYNAPLVSYDTNVLAVDYTGWYKAALGARYYANSVLGSQEEDFYYLRNGTGLRLQTMDGLQGDIGPANAYGTSRPTGGAYASLDPGWGPKDERVWITARSPYVQNCTTFGYAAVGQKIDGALHDGGNDSIVSNDFTQVISDGIGAWLLNNGRAELVSVFTYYAHIGYLCETGGRARATNGNNSYGTYGSVAEGVDPDEVPVTAVVDNSTQYNATISNVFTDTDAIQRLEFSHAGNDYTEANINIFGAGENESLLADEFRDGAINRIQIGETVETPSNAGGTNYTVVSNTAQAGSLTNINLAATDGSISSAYVGMAIYITGGAGSGNYGYITSYNSGSKLAAVSNRYGVSGWSHVVPGTTIVAPNSSSTYQVEPRITIPAPANAVATVQTIATDDFNNIEFVETSNTYTGVVSESNSDGSGATFDVTRNGSKYYVTINNTGKEFTRLSTVTIKGGLLGGTDVDNNIVVTITTVNASGAIVDFDFAGIGRKGYFIALADGNFYTSIDGTTSASWTAITKTGDHQNLASALLNDGSSTAKPHAAVATRVSSNVVSVSVDDALGTWADKTLSSLTAGTAMNVATGYIALGTNRFIVTSNSDQDVAYSDDGGTNWSTYSTALPGTGYDCLTYGKGLFVALDSGSTNAQTSPTGETWTARTLPNSKTWIDVVWGNGIFVALASDTGANNMAHSIDGITWVAASTPSATATPSGIAYGQGVFVITYSDDETIIGESFDGVTWTEVTGLTDIGEKVAFGNPPTIGATTPIGRFVSVDDTSNTAKTIFRGAPALGRAGVANQKIFEVRMTEPGSGYEGAAPTITVTDPGNIEDVVLVPKIRNGALANPTFINRGTSFITASAEVDGPTSNGGADFTQSGQFVAVRRLSATPVNGSNVEFDSLPGQFFKLVNTVSLVGLNDGSKTAFLQLSPDMSITDAPVDGNGVTMRIRFSQVRLTGHDFLDIGTGGFTTTNYPGIPTIAPDQAKETKDDNGGRVFFTATDQDGNFRVGDLFSIEQATGVATLNAEAFNIAGLQELSLGEVTLGGNSASISEFSTDPFFTANSDTVVPTQRAVKAYIEAQIGGGGATLNVNSVTAGDIFVNTNQITTVSGEQINIKANVNFTGSVLGLPMAYNYFLR